MSTENLPFVSADGTISSELVLPDTLRHELAKPFGPVISSHEVAGYIRGCGRLYSVGDMVTKSLIDFGIRPDVMIYDLRTQRGPCEKEIIKTLQKVEGNTLRIQNPAGTITPGLWNAVNRATKSVKKTKIEVKGEEDLASLACIEIAARGDCVIYGIPDEGISVIRIDDEIKKIVRKILSKMATAHRE